MKQTILGFALLFALGGSAYAATCCIGAPCCDEPMPCCDE
jgi:hypothetical protein